MSILRLLLALFLMLTSSVIFADDEKPAKEGAKDVREGINKAADTVGKEVKKGLNAAETNVNKTWKKINKDNRKKADEDKDKKTKD